MAEWTRDTPWRQGHLIPSEAILAVDLFQSVPTTQAVVAIVTHDCDLTQPISREPDIEVIIGRCVDKIDGNFSYSKNPRLLHIEFEGSPGLTAEFQALAKAKISKQRLLPYLPRIDARLSVEGLATFQHWLASRYRRSAFPNEFETRLSDKKFKIATKISGILSPLGSHVTGIFFDVDDGHEVEKNSTDDTYKLNIILLYPSGPDPIESEKLVSAAATEISILFRSKLYSTQNGWHSIELESCDAISEEALNYSTFKLLKRWRLDHLSLAANEGGGIVTE